MEARVVFVLCVWKGESEGEAHLELHYFVRSARDGRWGRCTVLLPRELIRSSLFPRLELLMPSTPKQNSSLQR